MPPEVPDTSTTPESAPPGRRGRAILSPALHLVPAAVMGLLLAGFAGGFVGAVLAFAVLLVAPGWLLWKLLGGPVSDDPLALPAVWFVFSFTLLSPMLGAFVLFGGPASAVEWYAFAVLLGLGIAASRVPHPRVGKIGKPGIVVAATAGVAAVYRALVWHAPGDDLTFIRYIREVFLGSYPSTSPFLTGDLPVTPRFRFSGWTGVTGVVSHLGDADPELVLRTVMPALLVVFVSSALFLLTRVLSDDRRLAVMAAVAALVVPFITGTTGIGDFKFTYASVAFDRFTALMVFVPVTSALLVAFYRSRSRSSGVIAAIVLWSSVWTHAVIAALGVAVFVVFVLLDGLTRRPQGWRSAAGWSVVLVAPLLITGTIISLSGERHGALPSDVDDLSEIAAPTRQLGPIDIWTPLSPSRQDFLEAGPEDSWAMFSRGYAATPEGTAVAFLSNGWPFAHPRILDNPRYLFMALAAVVIVVGRRRDGVALWLAASIVTALSVFLLPPFAAVVARFVTPWQLYRLAWLMPVPLAVAWLVSRALSGGKRGVALGVAIGVLVGLVFTWSNHSTVLRTGPSSGRERVATTVESLEGYSGVILAPRSLNNEILARWPGLRSFSFRGYTSMSNAFPVSGQPEAFERYRDGRVFFMNIPDSERLEILDRYGVQYVVIHSDDTDGFDLDALGLELVEPIGQGNLLYER